MNPDSLMSWQLILSDLYKGVKQVGGDIVQAIKTSAPWIWTIAQKQVYADAIGNVLVTLCFFIPLVISCIKVWKYNIKELSYDDRDGISILRAVTSILVGIAFILVIVSGVHLVKVCINPDYYTIQLIMEVVRGK